jgi:hypothetical protein
VTTPAPPQTRAAQIRTAQTRTARTPAAQSRREPGAGAPAGGLALLERPQPAPPAATRELPPAPPQPTEPVPVEAPTESLHEETPPAQDTPEEAPAEEPAEEAPAEEPAEEEPAEKPAGEEPAEGTGGQGAAQDPAAAAPAAQGRAAAPPEGATPLGLVPPRPARIGVPRLDVELPPPMPAERVRAIQQQTSLAPREHHARLRQRAGALHRQVRRAQIEVIHRTEWTAADLRRDILALARQAASDADATEQGLRTLLGRCRQRMRDAAQAARTAIRGAVFTDIATMDRTREQALAQIQTHLLAEAGVIRETSDQIGAQYGALSAQAAGQMRNLPNTAEGTYQAVAAPAPGAGPAAPAAAAEVTPSPSAKMVQHGADLARRVAAEGRGNLGTYVAWRRSQFTPDQASLKHRELLAGAAARAATLDGESVRQSMLFEISGLAHPAASAVERDQAGEQAQEGQEITTEREAVEQARQDALLSVDRILEQLISGENGLDAQERRLIDGVRRARAQAVRSLQDQALVASNAVLQGAEAWASAWKEALEPVRALLPPGQFLDSEALLPRLRPWSSAFERMRRRQLTSIARQAQAALEGATRAQHNVSNSIRQMLPSAREQLEPLVSGSERDFALRGLMWTNDVNEGVRTALASARQHAETTLAEHVGQYGGSVQQAVAAWLAQHIVPRLNEQLASYKGEHDRAVAGFEQEMRRPGGIYAQIETQVGLELRRHAGTLAGALPVPSTAAVVGIGALAVVSGGAALVVGGAYLYHIDPNEDSALDAVTKVPRQGRPALEDEFNTRYDPDLRDRLGRLSANERATIEGFLDARTARDEARALEALSRDADDVFGFSTQARTDAVAAMPDDALAALRARPGFEETRQRLLDGLNTSQLDLASSYLDHGVAAGFEARVHTDLQRAASQGTEAYVRQLAQIESQARTDLGDTYFAAFVDPQHTQHFLDDVYRQGAVRASGGRLSHERARTLDPAEARRRYAGFQARLAPAEAQRAARATIRHGQDSDQAFVEHAAFWTERAGRGGLTQNQQVGIDTSMSDPQLDRALLELEQAPPGSLRRLAAARQVEALRARRERRMGLLADRLRLQPQEGQTGSQAVSARLSALYGQTHGDAGRRYASTLVEHGRGELGAAIEIASAGAGTTNDDLMRQVTAGRSAREVQQARSDFAASHPGQTLDSFLGIGPGASWGGGELSGDLAHEIERNLVGGADTDRGRAEMALLSVFQQLDHDPGPMASLLAGSPEEAAAQQDRQRLVAFLAERAGVSPDQVLGPDRRPRSEILSQVFDAEGGLRRRPGETREALAGQAHVLQRLSDHAELGSQLYREEVDRIEASAMVGVAIFTAVLTLALIATGVGIVLAGVIAAVAGGVATMSVKYGLRGSGRYGYEEAMVDVAMTAVEAGVAWAGGAVAGRMARGVGIAGRLASGLSNTLGRTGGRVAGAVLREGMQGFVNSAAQTALDPATWRDSTGEGLSRVTRSGARGAAVQAMAAGVSEGLGEVISRQGRRTVGMIENTVDAGRASAARRASRSPLTDALLEGGSEALGAAAGEGVGLMFDRQTNAWDGDMAVALLRIGRAAARDFATSSVRSRLVSMHRARVDDQMRALTSQETPPTPAQISSLRRAMIASGAIGFGDTDTLPRTVEQLGVARALVQGLDPSTRTLLAGLPPDVLADVRARLDAGDLGDETQREVLLARVAEADPRLDLARFESLFGPRAQAEPEAPPRTQDEVRQHLLQGLPPELASRLAGLEVEGLQGLPAHVLREMGVAVAAGRAGDEATLLGLLRAARRAVPDLDPELLRGALLQLDAAQLQARQARQADALEQRLDVLRQVAPEHRPLLALLDDAGIATLRDLMGRAEPPTLAERAALLRTARAADPELDVGAFNRAVMDLHRAGRAAAEAQQTARRAERAELLDALPPALRGPVAALPEGALATLRDWMARGHLPTLQERAALVQAARQQDGRLDVARLARALHLLTGQAAAQQQVQATTAARRQRELRGALLSSVPVEMRGALAGTPLRELSEAEYRAARPSGATEHGYLDLGTSPPGVVLRQGAPPEAVRELGATLAVLRDPAAAEIVARTHAGRDEDYHRTPISQQVAAHRAQLEVQLEAQRRIVAELQAALSQPGADVPALQRQLYRAQRALVGLQASLASVRDVGLLRRMGIALGVARRPPPIDTVPRMIAEDPQARLLSLQAGRTDVVAGMRLDPFADAAGQPMFDQTTGAPVGYQVRYGFDARWFPHGLTQLTIRVHLDAAQGVGAEQLARVRANAQAGLDQYYNFRHQVRGPDGRMGPLHIEVQFVSDPARAHVSVQVEPGTGQTTQRRWHTGDNPTTLAHELSHQLGRLDEYVDHAPHGYQALNRRTATSPGVRHDHGLMGNYWQGAGQVHPLTHIPQRYLDQMQGDLDAARPGLGRRLLGWLRGPEAAAPVGPEAAAPADDFARLFTGERKTAALALLAAHSDAPDLRDALLTIYSTLSRQRARGMMPALVSTLRAHCDEALENKDVVTLRALASLFQTQQRSLMLAVVSLREIAPLAEVASFVQLHRASLATLYGEVVSSEGGRAKQFTRVLFRLVQGQPQAVATATVRTILGLLSPDGPESGSVVRADFRRLVMELMQTPGEATDRIAALMALSSARDQLIGQQLDMVAKACSDRALAESLPLLRLLAEHGPSFTPAIASNARLPAWAVELATALQTRNDLQAAYSSRQEDIENAIVVALGPRLQEVGSSTTEVRPRDLIPEHLRLPEDDRSLLALIQEFRQRNPNVNLSNHRLVAYLTRTHILVDGKVVLREVVRPSTTARTWFAAVQELARNLQLLARGTAEQWQAALQRSSLTITRLRDPQSLLRAAAAELARTDDSPPQKDHLEFVRITSFGEDIAPIAERRIGGDEPGTPVSLINAIVAKLTNPIRVLFGAQREGGRLTAPILGPNATGRSYQELTAGLRLLVDDEGNAYSDRRLAQALMGLLHGTPITLGNRTHAPPTTAPAEVREALQELTYLLFVRETVRHPANAVLSAMVVELIAAGRMSWREAMDLYQAPVERQADENRAAQLRMSGEGGLLPHTQPQHQRAMQQLQEGADPTKPLADYLFRFSALLVRWLEHRGQSRDLSDTQLQNAIQDLIRSFFRTGVTS